MSKRGENITKRKDGRWEARVRKGYDENGKTLYKYVYGKTYGEVKQKRDEAIASIPLAENYTRNKIIFGSILSDFLSHTKYTVKESTYAHYVDVINMHIRPQLGRLRSYELSASVIENFTAEKLRSGRLDGKGGLSVKNVKDMLSIIRSAIKYGMNNKILSSDLLTFSTPRSEKSDIETLSTSEQKKLEAFSLLSDDPNKFGVFICLYTGLRIGELCALRWCDIDFISCVINVNKTLMRIKNSDGGSKTKIIIDMPKTKSSERQIPIPEFLLKRLIERRQLAEDKDGYVLTGTNRYIEPSNYFVKYKRWLTICGIGDYSFHALRHTFATRCIERGFDPKSLSEILGHADVNITLNRYVHPSMESKRRQMELLA